MFRFSQNSKQSKFTKPSLTVVDGWLVKNRLNMKNKWNKSCMIYKLYNLQGIVGLIMQHFSSIANSNESCLDLQTKGDSWPKLLLREAVAPDAWWSTGQGRRNREAPCPTIIWQPSKWSRFINKLLTFTLNSGMPKIILGR